MPPIPVNISNVEDFTKYLLQNGTGASKGGANFEDAILASKEGKKFMKALEKFAGAVEDQVKEANKTLQNAHRRSNQAAGWAGGSTSSSTGRTSKKGQSKDITNYAYGQRQRAFRDQLVKSGLADNKVLRNSIFLEGMYNKKYQEKIKLQKIRFMLSKDGDEVTQGKKLVAITDAANKSAMFHNSLVGKAAEGISNIALESARSAQSALGIGAEWFTISGLIGKAVGLGMELLIGSAKMNQQFKQMGYTTGRSLDNIEDQILAENMVYQTGEKKATVAKSTLKIYSKGLREEEKAFKIAKSGLALGNLIQADAEATSDVLGDWALHMQMTVNQTSMFARGIAEAARTTGITGEHLLQAVKSSEAIAKNMRDYGTFSQEALAATVKLSALGESRGVGSEVGQLQNMLSNPKAFFQSHSGSMSMLARILKETPELQGVEGAGLMGKWQTIMKDPELRTIAGKSMEKVGQHWLDRIEREGPQVGLAAEAATGFAPGALKQMGIALSKSGGGLADQLKDIESEKAKAGDKRQKELDIAARDAKNNTALGILQSAAGEGQSIEERTKALKDIMAKRGGDLKALNLNASTPENLLKALASQFGINKDKLNDPVELAKAIATAAENEQTRRVREQRAADPLTNLQDKITQFLDYFMKDWGVKVVTFIQDIVEFMENPLESPEQRIRRQRLNEQTADIQSKLRLKDAENDAPTARDASDSRTQARMEGKETVSVEDQLMAQAAAEASIATKSGRQHEIQTSRQDRFGTHTKLIESDKDQNDYYQPGTPEFEAKKLEIYNRLRKENNLPVLNAKLPDQASTSIEDRLKQDRVASNTSNNSGASDDLGEVADNTETTNNLLTGVHQRLDRLLVAMTYSGTSSSAFGDIPDGKSKTLPFGNKNYYRLPSAPYSAMPNRGPTTLVG